VIRFSVMYNSKNILHIVLTKDAAKTIIVLLVSGALLFYTIQSSGIQWHNLKLDTSKWTLLLGAMIVFLLSVWLQSIRIRIPWQLYFRNKSPDTLNGLMIGNFYNGILPGNAGELIRARHFSKKNNTSFIKALASLIVEKYIDSSNFILYAVLVLVFFQDTQIQQQKILGFVAFVAVVFLFYLFIILNKKTERSMLGFLINYFAAGKFLYKLHYNAKLFLLSLNSQRIFKFLLLGHIMFSLNVLQYYLVMHVAGLPAELLSLKMAFLVAVAMIIIYIVPSAPGSTGVVHFGIYAAMFWIALKSGIPETPQLKQTLAAYSFYLHFSYFIPEIFAGALITFKERKWIV